MNFVHFVSAAVALGAVLGISNGQGYPCTSAGAFCYDCHTATICRPWANGTFSEVLPRISCPPEAPNCNYRTGTCSNVPDDICGQSDDFLCTRVNGHFPDPYNCSVYHVCEGAISRKFSCPEGSNYNPESQQCDVNAGCSLPSCPTDPSKGVKVKYDLYSRYYAYCTDPGTSLTVMRCDGVYRLNETAQLCEATCNPDCDGLLPNYVDCSTYYECKTAWITDKIKVQLRQLKRCPPETYYDQEHFACSVDADSKSCLPKDDSEGANVPSYLAIEPRFSKS